MVEMAKIESLYHISSLEAMDFLNEFVHEPRTQIFGFLDVEKNGSITFKQACELAFAECDEDGYNYCTKKEFADILRRKFPDPNDGEVHGLFGLFDTDTDGRMSRDDFLRKNPLLIAVFSPRLLRKKLSKARDKMLEEIV
ncbi:Detected protein of confused Function [Hibiscus syriacus]|uniref:Detected protein of confused Function n=1 Tax=Hibiscus syriacus TaxID=106335 RepID=A0A6A2X9D5_HIBSY|nr:Detected protein of confused Function [Hibiscus syriacus]